MAAPKLTRKYLLWAKIESNYGVDPTPTASNTVLADTINFKLIPSLVERDGISIPDLSKFGPLVGKYYGEVDFSCYLMGSGNAAKDVPPDFGVLLRACSMDETINAGTNVIYNPVSSDQESCTLWVNKDGVLHKLNGCVGTFKMSGGIGQPAKLSFTMRGKLEENPTDVALTSPTYLNVTPPLLLSANFSYGGWTPPISTFSLDIANKITERPDINQESGIIGFFVSDRKPIVQFDPEMVSVATRNMWNNFRTLNESSLSLSLGSIAGNRVAISAPKCIKRGLPYGDRDGLAKYDLEAALIRTSGDDEFTLTFT